MEPVEKKPWSNGLCDCCGDCRHCLCAALCPCCLFSQNAFRVGMPCGLILWFVPGVNFCCCVWVRGKVRKRTHVEGGCLTDACVHACCHPCGLIQEARQLDEADKGQEIPAESVVVYVDKQPQAMTRS